MKPIVRSIACGLVLAVAGFAYAFATSRSIDAPAPQAGSRAVGTSTLRFMNAIANINTPPAPNDYDLGDACYGSFITRYITVTGGVRPYRYSGSDSLNALLFPGSTLSVGNAGCVMGTVVSPSSLSPFVIQATDSSGTFVQQVNGNFFLNMQACGNGVFRFAVSAINNGILGQSYISKLEVLGGNAPVVFSIQPGSLTVNGAQVGVGAGLEAIGLSMGEDGTIKGRPLVTGLVSFTARATDRLRRIATGRASATVDQVITFNIEDTSVTSTDGLALSVNVKGDLGKANKDSLKFTATMNLSGSGAAVLNGTDFSIKLGGATISGIFNVKGQATNSRGGPLVFADGSRLKMSVNPRSGQIKGNLTKANLGRLLGAESLQDRGTKRLGMSMELCDFVIHCDTIEFATRIKGNKFAMDYKLGKVGRPLGGAFLITSTRGKDGADIAGNLGDAWDSRFIFIPRFGIDANAGLDALTAIRVRIGSRFVFTIPASSLSNSGKGAIKLQPTKTKAPVVSKFTLDPRKFTGSLQTTVISQFITGIPQAKVAVDAGRNSANYNLGIDLDRSGNNADLIGEYGKQIFTPLKGPGSTKAGAGRGQNKWVDQVNLR
ncbi:MAG TPA: hypothetical protein VEJ63_19760 [Planctomycetota bacterium]|nr:hypothetical protein [Planctomycetota bacterium]